MKSTTLRSVILGEANWMATRFGCAHESAELLTRLTRGASIAKFAYQPTFFAHINVVAQLLHLHDLCQNDMSLVPIMFIVDYDVASENRFRRSDLPSRTGTFHLRSGVSKKIGDKARFRTVESEANGFQLIKSQWQSYLRQSDLTPSVRRSSDDLFDEGWWPDNTGFNLADKCLLSLKRALFEIFHAPILFVRLSQLRRYQRSEILTLLGAINSSTGEWHKVWTVCLGCGHRIPATHGDDPACSNCLTSVTLADDGWPAIVYPSVQIDNLLDYIDPIVERGTSYLAGFKHLRETELLASKMGLRFGPENVWSMDTILLVPGTGSSGIDGPHSARFGMPFWLCVSPVLDWVQASLRDMITDRSSAGSLLKA